MRPVGPLWLGPVAEKSLLGRMQDALSAHTLNTRPELHTLLDRCREELDLSSHYDYHKLARILGRSPPPLDSLRQILTQEGYQVSRAHYSGTALKTDAPLEALLRAVRMA